MREKKQILWLLIFCSLLTVAFIKGSSSDREIKAIVLETKDENIIQSGLTRIGDQSVKVEIIEGQYKKQSFWAKNHLVGKFELDNYYKTGDKVIIAILEDQSGIQKVQVVDMYRQGHLLGLLILFAVSVIVFAKLIGLKALISFFISLGVIWKVLIPELLEGANPLLMATIVVIILTGVIIFLVAGLTAKGITACAGTILGLCVAIGITLFFGERMSLYGLMPYAENLMYSGYMHLDFQGIFYAAIIIGASGAAMDIGMDIAASMEELVLKKPSIGRRELIESGFNVGRSVIGTMSTTLLLAYSGGYLTLLMVFANQQTSLMRMLNMKIVVAELMRTLVGSMGLLMVAPLTAIIGGYVYTHSHFNTFNQETEEDMPKKEVIFE